MGKSPASAEPMDERPSVATVAPGSELVAGPTLLAELRSSLMLLALFAAIVASTAILAFAASQS